MRIYYYKNKNNFGEQIIFDIMKFLGVDKLEYADKKHKGKLLCIGSELAEGTAQHGDVIFGYGAKRKVELIIPDSVKILAVRGWNTAKQIKNRDVKVVGDPGCLMSLVYNPKSKNKKYDLGVIPHYVDAFKFNSIVDKKVKIINVLDDRLKIINEMNECNMIASTSLHGCIVAESYGIPSVWIKTENSKILGVDYKWNDYLSGTDREETKANILPLNFTIKDIISATKKPLPRPKLYQNELIEAWRKYFD